MFQFTIPMTDAPCPRCMALVDAGQLDPETMQRMPAGAFAPRARDGSGPCCRDCGAADAIVLPGQIEFPAARVAVGNDRLDSYRWPPGVDLGLVRSARMGQPTETLEEHHAWLDSVLPGWSESRDRT